MPALVRNPEHAPENYLKAVVLYALWQAQKAGTPLTALEVAQKVGLPRTRVRARLEKAMHQQYVTRSATREFTANGTAYRFALASRGQMWLTWAQQRGLLVEALAAMNYPGYAPPAK